MAITIGRYLVGLTVVAWFSYLAIKLLVDIYPILIGGIYMAMGTTIFWIVAFLFAFKFFWKN